MGAGEGINRQDAKSAEEEEIDPQMTQMNAD